MVHWLCSLLGLELLHCSCASSAEHHVSQMIFHQNFAKGSGKAYWPWPISSRKWVAHGYISLIIIQSHNNHHQPSQSDFEKNMTLAAQRKELRKGNCWEFFWNRDLAHSSTCFHILYLKTSPDSTGPVQIANVLMGRRNIAIGFVWVVVSKLKILVERGSGRM